MYKIGWAIPADQGIQSGSDYVRPPRDDYGLAWSAFAPEINIQEAHGAPPFSDVYTHRLKPKLAEAEFIAAHAAHHDRRHLVYCCKQFHCDMLDLRWIDTMVLARYVLGFHHAKLRQVAAHLGIDEPHGPEGDARIALHILQEAVRRVGWAEVRQFASRAIDRPPLPSKPQRERDVWNAFADCLDNETLEEMAMGDDYVESGRGDSRHELLDRWISSYHSNLNEMLADMPRDLLQDACHRLGLDDSGYSRKLTDRLLSFSRITSSTAIGDARSIAPGSQESVSKGSGHNRGQLRAGWPIWQLVTRLLGLGLSRNDHHETDRGVELRSVLASIMYREELVEACRMSMSPPPGFQRLKRAELEKYFANNWRGNLKDLLNYLYADTLKAVFDELGIQYPRLKPEMIEDLIRRYG